MVLSENASHVITYAFRPRCPDYIINVGDRLLKLHPL